MSYEQNISIIQLIKNGEISVEVEVSHVRAKEDVDVKILSYFHKVDYYNDISGLIDSTKEELAKSNDSNHSDYLQEKIKNLSKVKSDYIQNALYLAQTLAEINPNNERLKKAIVLFDAGKIKEADNLLDEADLLNDQYNLIAFISYQEKKIKLIENEL